MRRRVALLSLLASLCLSAPAQAETTIPFDIALCSDARLFFWVDDPFIAPLSINIIGSTNRGVAGLELGGVYNWNEGDVTGIQVAGIFNNVDGDLSGIQFGGLFNYVERDVTGIQLSFIANYSERRCAGICAAGVFNRADGDLLGLQLGLWNIALGDHSIGAQLGLISSAHTFSIMGDTSTHVTYNTNKSASFTGLQVSIWNSAYHMNGLQIGLLNSTDSGFAGLQLALLNMGGVAETHESVGLHIGLLGNFNSDVYGVQIGSLLNAARSVHGAQIGVINLTTHLRGIQIGALNIATEAPIPFLPVLNVGW